MSDWVFVCEIPGAPIGKGRARGTAIGGHVRLYTPKKTADWERSAAMVMSSCWRSAPMDEPVEVEIVALASRPKRLLRKKDPDGPIWKVTKPDSDNICKSVFDSLVMAGVLRDDCFVVQHRILDLFAERVRGPRLVVRIRPALSEPRDGWWNHFPKTLVQVFQDDKDSLPW